MLFHKFLYYFKIYKFVFSPELIFFFVAIKVLPRFINHFYVKSVFSNLRSRTCIRDKYLFSKLSQGVSYDSFEACIQGKSYSQGSKKSGKIKKSARVFQNWVTGYSSEDFPSRTTWRCLLLRKEEIRPNIWPEIP